ncbi:MAG TPA: hypothetical protein VF677_02555 [Flavobacterium sp.]|jgi:hypothetical protein
MATIQSVSGKYDPAKSKSGSLWVLLADEQNIFEVPEWIPQTTTIGSAFDPPDPDEIEKPKAVTWTLKDKSQKEVLHTFTSNVLQKLAITINKQYAGSYPYYLEAVLDGTKEKTGVHIQGYAPSLITVFNWGKDSTYTDKSELKQGESIYVHLETEGLNGDKLKLEIYDEAEKKALKEFDAECINGIIEASFNTLGIVNLKPNTNKTLSIKVKHISGVYVKNTSAKEALATFTINDKVQVTVQVPQNNAPLKVGEPDKNTTTTGFISLERIAVDTKYDVCHDEVGKFDDYKNFWILKGNKSPITGIEYYHWIKKSDLGDPAKGGDKEDLTKPPVLPVTLSSEDQLTFTVVFKTIFPTDAKVRVRDKEKQYTFTIENYPKSAAKEHEIKFTSQTSPPYKGTVQYFPNLELIFDYSLDGKSWTPLGSAQFCLYLTWKEPAFSEFIFSAPINEIKDMKIECTKSGKRNILETLLWIGCNNAVKKGKSEEEIIDAIFTKIQTTKIDRSRKGNNTIQDGVLGYWRGVADANTTTFGSLRCLRYLIANGEGRCGEWSQFLRHLCYTQGIISIKDLPFNTAALNTSYLPLTDIIKLGFNYSKSPADQKGNYPVTDDGKIYLDTIKYDQKLMGVFLVNSPAGSWDVKPSKPPKQLKARAQGNDNPLHFFWDHVFMVHMKGTDIKYYDPSYGAKGNIYHSDSTKLFEEYTKSNLSAIIEVSIPQTGGKKFRDVKHTKKYADFFHPYTFFSSDKDVPNFTFNNIESNIETHILY